MYCNLRRARRRVRLFNLPRRGIPDLAHLPRPWINEHFKLKTVIIII